METDPDVARLKASLDLVRAIEPAVRFYEEPPTEGMTVTTPGSDIWLSAHEWAAAFEAPDPGTPHNEAREQVWEELLTILTQKADPGSDGDDDGDAPPHLLRKSLQHNDELVIRTVLPDANVPTSIRTSGIPVVHGSTADLGSVLDTWLAAHDAGIACLIGDPTFRATPRVRSLTPELSKGLEFDLVVLIDAGAGATAGAGGAATPDKRIEGAVDRYVAMTRATRQLVILQNP